MATKSRAAQNGHARRKVMKWLKAQGLPCRICGLPIDYTIDDPHDPMHFECDEIVPVSLGARPSIGRTSEPRTGSATSGAATG